MGRRNNSVEEAVEEFVGCALESGASAGLTVAAAGGVTVAARNGFLGSVLRSTPVGTIANAVAIGVENLKIMCRIAEGEITMEKGLDKMGDATVSMAISLAEAGAGMTIGTVLFGPIGAVAGGVICGIAGSTLGHEIWECGKKIVKSIKDFVKGTAKKKRISKNAKVKRYAKQHIS